MTEEQLLSDITGALETHGYLPRLRAGLKVISLKKAQQMVDSGILDGNKAILPKKLSQKDAKLASLCLQLFEFCNLKHTADMLRLEADFQPINPNTEYHQNGDIPVICSLLASP